MGELGILTRRNLKGEELTLEEEVEGRLRKYLAKC